MERFLLLRSRTGILLSLSIVVIALGVGLKQRSIPLLGQTSSGPPTTWTSVPGMPEFTSAAYGNGTFVAVNNLNTSNSSIWYSPDGITWTENRNTEFSIYGVNAVAFGNGRFVIGGYNSRISTSTDGITWTAVNLPPNIQVNLSIIESMAFGNGTFVAAGMGAVATSTDGVTWRQATIVNQVVPDNSIAYGNGKFVVVGDGGYGSYSTDGMTWSDAEMTFGKGSRVGALSIKSVAFGNGRFVAVGEQGWGAYSTDGATWTRVPDMTFGTETIKSIAFGNGYFVAVGGNAKAAYSSDGITWTAITGMPFEWYNGILAVAFGDGRF
jgi:hypothetical protein